jgi:hypothetical protein
MIKRIHNFLGKQLKVLHLPLALYFSLLSLSRVVSAPPRPPPKMYKTREKKKCQRSDPDIIIQCGSGLIEKALSTLLLSSLCSVHGLRLWQYFSRKFGERQPPRQVFVITKHPFVPIGHAVFK